MNLLKMRPFDTFLFEAFEGDSKCSNTFQQRIVNEEGGGDKSDSTTVGTHHVFDEKPQCVESTESLITEESTINGCGDDVIDMTLNSEENEVQTTPMEIDEFSSREAVRKLINVDDNELSRLISLAENSEVSCVSPNEEEMRKYCAEHGIKPDFTVTRKQFLRFREHAESMQQVDYSWHPKGKKRKEYETEAIIDYDEEEDKYLVKWEGWPHETNTWEPESHLESSRELLEEFRCEMEEYKKNNLAQQWVKDVSKLQLYLHQIVSKEYSDLCVLKKLKPSNAIKFNMKLAKKQIAADIEILSEITSKSFPNYTLGSKRVANIICEKLKLREIFGSLEGFFDFIEKRKTTLKNLKSWELSIHSAITAEGKSKLVYVENLVDLEGPPDHFQYITECKMNINEERNKHFEELNMNPVHWCTHKDCFADKKTCCPTFFDANYVYTRDGSLKDCVVQAIVECNSKCSCDEGCSNRVIQKGTQVELIIFRTDDGRGWGVKAKERILARQFVMEYIGEVISVEEADERGRRYDSEGRTYLFDLDFDVDAQCVYSVDATKFGNVSHFVNHSCDPNLEVTVAWVNHLDRQLPRLVFFSKRQIQRGEELTFDYRMTRPERSGNDLQIECKCGSKTCKKFLCI